MKIKTKGRLDIELTRLGLKPGDVIEASKDPFSTVGAVNFNIGSSSCVLWPENYDIISDDKFALEQIVEYTNGTYTGTGTIKTITPNSTLIVINQNDAAALELWQAGYAVGTEISYSQVKKIVKQ